jgi:DNA-binding CsgD family transcriptional regulator
LRPACHRRSAAAGSRECGGMPPSDFEPDTGRDLSFAEREEITFCRAYGHGVREIAQRLSRSPSTISRELRRNAATRAAAQAGLTARRRANALRNAGFSASISILALIIRTPILGFRPGRHHSLTWPIPHRRPRAVGCCRHPSGRAEWRKPETCIGIRMHGSLFACVGTSGRRCRVAAAGRTPRLARRHRCRSRLHAVPYGVLVQPAGGDDAKHGRARSVAGSSGSRTTQRPVGGPTCPPTNCDHLLSPREVVLFVSGHADWLRLDRRVIWGRAQRMVWARFDCSHLPPGQRRDRSSWSVTRRVRARVDCVDGLTSTRRIDHPGATAHSTCWVRSRR